MQESTSTPTSATSMSKESMEMISERLSQIENLYFPRAVQSSTASPSQRKSLLLSLLSRDVSLFLERYGSQLTLQELEEFDLLKDDYEINWHLNHLRTIINPSQEDLKIKSTKVRNRRRAYMDQLISDGNYFSEDAMREREPYLHHEYVGKFQDPSGRSMARPGERWSETLMRRTEEAMLVEKIRTEQQRRGVAQSDWVGFERARPEEEMEEMEEEEEEESNEEEESSEEEDTEEQWREAAKHLTENGASDHQEVQSNDQDASVNEQSSTATPTEVETLSAEEMQDRMDQFTYIMQQKFLSGEDNMDYSKIDTDETLDDHWLKEANHDAEEKYFDDL